MKIAPKCVQAPLVYASRQGGVRRSLEVEGFTPEGGGSTSAAAVPFVCHLDRRRSRSGGIWLRTGGTPHSGPDASAALGMTTATEFAHCTWRTNGDRFSWGDFCGNTPVPDQARRAKEDSPSIYRCGFGRGEDNSPARDESASGTRLVTCGSRKIPSMQHRLSFAPEGLRTTTCSNPVLLRKFLMGPVAAYFRIRWQLRTGDAVPGPLAFSASCQQHGDRAKGWARPPVLSDMLLAPCAKCRGYGGRAPKTGTGLHRRMPAGSGCGRRPRCVSSDIRTHR